jgi:hypothetical protein
LFRAAIQSVVMDDVFADELEACLSDRCIDIAEITGAQGPEVEFSSRLINFS